METLRQPLKETRTASLNVPRVLSPTDFTSRTSFYGINTDVDKDLAEKVHSNNDWKIHQFVCISIQTYEYLSTSKFPKIGELISWKETHIRALSRKEDHRTS